MTKPYKAISQDELKEHLHYDPDTGVFTYIKKATRATVVGSNPAKVSGNGYLGICFKGLVYKCHRLAWLYVYGEMPEQIDHINGDRADNRIANLRPANNSMNGMNRRLQSNNRLGFKGVWFHRKTNKYTAAISKDKVKRHLGYFHTPQEAHAAYVKAAQELHGEFARFN